MPNRLLPASIRTLKARLTILQRPAVWGAASVLLVAIVFLAETWKNPQRLASPNTPAGSEFTTPSDSDAQGTEEATRFAPLDPLSSTDEPLFGNILPQDTQNSELERFSFSSEDFAGAGEDTSLVSPLLLTSPSSTSRRTSSSALPDPFASMRSRRSTAESNPLTATSADNPFSRSRNSTDSDTTSKSPFSAGNPSVSSSPSSLQSASNQQSAPLTTQQSPAVPLNSAATGVNSTANTARTTTGTTNGAIGNSELQTPVPTLSGQSAAQSTYVQPQPLPGQPSYGQTQPQPQFIPQTSPAPGTTGYTVPPAFRTNENTPAGPSFGPNSATYYNVQPGSGVPPTGFSSPSPSGTYGSGAYNSTMQPQGVQPQTSSAPFSVPRPVPGQSIGGGQINTFSNP